MAMLLVHTSANKSLGICTLERRELPGATQVPGSTSHCTGRHANGLSCLKTAGATHQFKLSELPFLNAAELLD